MEKFRRGGKGGDPPTVDFTPQVVFARGWNFLFCRGRGFQPKAPLPRDRISRNQEGGEPAKPEKTGPEGYLLLRVEVLSLKK